MSGFIEITLKTGEKALINTAHIHFVTASTLKGQDIAISLKDIEETYEEIKKRINLVAGGKVKK